MAGLVIVVGFFASAASAKRLPQHVYGPGVVFAAAAAAKRLVPQYVYGPGVVPQPVGPRLAVMPGPGVHVPQVNGGGRRGPIWSPSMSSIQHDGDYLPDILPSDQIPSDDEPVMRDKNKEEEYIDKTNKALESLRRDILGSGDEAKVTEYADLLLSVMDKAPPVSDGSDGATPLTFGSGDEAKVKELTEAANVEEKKMKKTLGPRRTPQRRNEKNTEYDTRMYNVNVGRAFDSLMRDIPQLLRFEDDPQRLTPTDWGIYTDDFETDYTDIVNPAALRLFGLRRYPAARVSLKGKRLNMRALRELRQFCSKFLEIDMAMEKTGRALDLGNQVVTSRWQTELSLKRFKLPFERSTGVDLTLESTVAFDAVSKFHFNDEGKIYKHSVDQFDILIDQKPATSQQMDLLLKMVPEDPSFPPN